MKYFLFTYDGSGGRPNPRPVEVTPPQTSTNNNATVDSTQASNSSDKGQPQGVANKDYIELEYFILEGSCDLIANTDTIKIKAGNTVNCLGLGKYLSGLYFVDELTRTIDNNGYSHSMTVQKNGFGETLKSGIRDTINDIQSSEPERPPVVQKSVAERQNTLRPKQQGASGFSSAQKKYTLLQWS